MRIFVLALFALLLTACDDSGSSNSSSSVPAAVSGLALSFSAVKSFDFTWTDASGATYYKLMENEDSSSGFTQVGSNISTGSQAYSHIVPLYARMNSQYILQSCNDSGCTDSNTISISDSLADSIGYVKASNSGTKYNFGNSVALSEDGTTLAVASHQESSNATGINGDQSNRSAGDSGAVYVFIRNNNNWSQEAYIKSSNSEYSDYFATDIALSSDGNTLAVGADQEDSSAKGIDGDQTNNDLLNSGAVYVFTRSNSTWSQQAYIKASNTESSDYFGDKIAISSDGDTLAVGAYLEDSNATGINGDDSNNTASESGAVYVFSRSNTTWSQQAYIKSSNTESEDYFGNALDLSSDGNTLVIGAVQEDSNATGIGGSQSNNSASLSGAVYVYIRNNTIWSQQSYIKGSNTEAGDRFAYNLTISGDGDTLAVSASGESSNSTGINGDQSDNSSFSGAVYLFTRSNQVWSQQAYLKSSNSEAGDGFGQSLALSSDGDILAVASHYEDSNATGINGDQTSNSTTYSGAVYTFSRNSDSWSQQAYLKSTNPEYLDVFGYSLDISSDGNTLAIGAIYEDSDADGIDGDNTNNDALFSGAVYLY